MLIGANKANKAIHVDFSDFDVTRYPTTVQSDTLLSTRAKIAGIIGLRVPIKQRKKRDCPKAWLDKMVHGFAGLRPLHQG